MSSNNINLSFFIFNFQLLSRKWREHIIKNFENYKNISFNFFFFENFLLSLFNNEIKSENISDNSFYKLYWKKYFWNPYSIYNIVSWKYKNTSSNIQIHTYHLVNASSLPLLASIGAFTFLFGFVLFMHNYKLGSFTLKYGLYFLILVSIFWWRDVIVEGMFKGFHTTIVKKGLRVCMILFIVSEVMFFFSFFWAFFHSSLNPSITLGSVWPPIGINPIDPVRIPLLNTAILLLSGIFLTWSHFIIKKKWLFNEYREKLLLDYFYFYPLSFLNISNNKININFINDISIFNNFNNYIIKIRSHLLNILNEKFNIFWLFHIDYLKQLWSSKNNNNSFNNISLYFLNLYFMFEALLSLIITIILGLEFTWWQYYEYYNATFYIFDGVYGSTFYMTTGLHGLHVLIGTLFLIVCLFRLYNLEFNWKSHIGYECAIWYWHFVDVVWIIVFSVIYCWGAGYDNFYK